MATSDEFPEFYFEDDNGDMPWDHPNWGYDSEIEPRDNDHKTLQEWKDVGRAVKAGEKGSRLHRRKITVFSESQTIENEYVEQLIEPTLDSGHIFETFQEAKSWAIKNPGRIITRSSNGEDFVIKDDRSLDKLWEWADKNKIDSKDLPRNEKGLFQLTTLKIQNYGLDLRIPKEISMLTQLSELLICCRDFEGFEADISKLTNLVSLKISACGFPTFPIEICNLPSLGQLELESIGIWPSFPPIPSQIKNLSNLRDLKLFLNDIGANLINELSVLQHLTYLEINVEYEDGITRITKPIENLVNLKTLIVNSRRIEIAKGIGSLQKITNVKLNGTRHSL